MVRRGERRASRWWRRARQGQSDRGDVPGWVLVTLMTAGIVTVLWATAGPMLRDLFVKAVQQVSP